MTHRSRLVAVLALAAFGCTAPAPPAPAPAPPVRETLQAAVAPPPMPSPTPSPLGTPTATVSPSPSPSPGKLDPDWKQGEAFPFNARPRPDVPTHDLYVYNERMDTVLALVGADTPFDDIQPVMSNDKAWIVYEQLRATHAGGTTSDVLLYNTVTQRREPLTALNTVAFNETSPTLDGDGRLIAYLSDETGRPELRLYDVAHHAVYEVSAVNRRFDRIFNPAFSGNGKLLAFSAAGGPGRLDVYLYDLVHGAVWAPPHVNTAFDEDAPGLNSDGSRLLFVSNRFGTFDLFEADLKTGFVDDLVGASTPRFDEMLPSYLGDDVRRILYRIVEPGGDLETFLFRIYDRKTGNVNTLPVANTLLLPVFLAQSPTPSPE